jgi:hypothetical protein
MSVAELKQVRELVFCRETSINNSVYLAKAPYIYQPFGAIALIKYCSYKKIS